MKFEFFSTDFRKSVKYQVSSKSVQFRAELFHADRQTDMKLIVAFRYFANTPKKCTPISDKHGVI